MFDLWSIAIFSSPSYWWCWCCCCCCSFCATIDSLTILNTAISNWKFVDSHRGWLVTGRVCLMCMILPNVLVVRRSRHTHRDDAYYRWVQIINHHLLHKIFSNKLNKKAQTHHLSINAAFDMHGVTRSMFVIYFSYFFFAFVFIHKYFKHFFFSFKLYGCDAI